MEISIDALIFLLTMVIPQVNPITKLNLTSSYKRGANESVEIGTMWNEPNLGLGYTLDMHMVSCQQREGRHAEHFNTRPLVGIPLYAYKGEVKQAGKQSSNGKTSIMLDNEVEYL